jgi:peptidoglycan/LPS O-acetylase OafA/YrhL
MGWDSPQMMMIAVGLVVVGFAVYIGMARLKSTLRKEPAEDELSKSIMTRASSLSYYMSIYLWLFIMYVSDKVKWETHTLVGAGILGMAIIFFLSWLGVKLFGLRNG